MKDRKTERLKDHLIRRFVFNGFHRLHEFQDRFHRRFTIAGRFVIGATGMSAVLGLDTHRTFAHQIFTILLFILLIAVGRGLIFRGNFAARRDLPRFGTVGHPLKYTVALHNLSGRPQRGIRLTEGLKNETVDFDAYIATTEPGEADRNLFDRLVGYYRWRWMVDRREIAKPPSGEAPTLPPRSETCVTLSLTPKRRGLLQFTSLHVARTDPMGLFNGLKRIELPQTLTILPERYPLPAVSLPGGRRFHAGGVSLTSSVGDSEEFVSLRDYRPGDPMRRIHWKSWARTGKPVVKEFQEEFFVRHALILDTFGDTFGDTFQKREFGEAFEAAVSLAASFACTVRTQESLLDLMFVGTEAFCFTAGRGLGYTEKILEILAMVRPCRDRPFESLSSLVMERSAHKTILLSGCICIFLDWDQSRAGLVRHLDAAGIPVLAMVVSDDASATANETPSPEATPETLGPAMSDTVSIHRLRAGFLAADLAEIAKRQST